MRNAVLLAPLAVLAACQSPTDTAANNAAAAPAEHGYIAKVQALPPGQRDLVLFRAIQKGGGSACQGVTGVETLPVNKLGQPMWRATCAEGAQWLVTLSDDGTALVTGARDDNAAR